MGTLENRLYNTWQAAKGKWKVIPANAPQSLYLLVRKILKSELVNAVATAKET